MTACAAFLQPLPTRSAATVRNHRHRIGTCRRTRSSPKACQKSPEAPNQQQPTTTTTLGSPPDYTSIDSNALNRFFTELFLRKLESEYGSTSETRGYAGVIETVKALHARSKTACELQAASIRVLDSLFPSWLPPAFSFVFSRNIPRAAAWINAVVTVVVTQWLMGPSKLQQDNVVQIDRCRYLEESGCVGICVNSCKSATESFFIDRMGLDLHIEPDFSDYSCKFRFGVRRPDAQNDTAYTQGCFATCEKASKRRTNTAANATKPCPDVS